MTENNLILLEDENAVLTRAAVAFQTPENLEPLLSALEQEARAHIQVLNTENGRKNIRKLHRQIGSAKNRIDEVGEKLNEAAKAHIKIINGNRSLAWERIEKLQAEIIAPLEQWESAEKERVAAHEAALKEIQALCVFDPIYPPPDSSALSAIIDRLSNDTRDWEEYKTRAGQIKSEVLLQLTKAKEQAIAREKEAADAEAARLAEEKRKQEEREAAIAAAAAKAARELAEAQAAVDLVYEQAQKENAEFDLAAEKQKAADAEAKMWRDMFAAADSDNESFDLQKKAREAAQAEALKAAELAAKAERDKIAAEEQKKAEEQSAREADEANRNKKNGEAIGAIEDVITDCLDFCEIDTHEIATQILTAIAQGKIPHVRIQY